MKKLMLCVLCVLLLLPVSDRASAESLYEKAASLVGLDGLEAGLTEEEREIGGTLRGDGQYDASGALSRLWRRLLESLRDSLHSQLRFAAALIALCLFCALASALTKEKSAMGTVSLAACCAAAAWIAGDWDSGIAQATNTLTRLSDYSKAALPVVFTAAAAAGAPSSASVRYASACLALDVLMSAADRLILPLIYSYLSLAVSGSIFDNPVLRAVQRLVKWCCVTSMTVMTLAFGAYISLSGLVAGSADALAVKAARSVIAAALPVVGGILSDSAAALLSAAGAIRSTAGIFSLLAVCAICMGPFVFLSVKMLLLKAVGTLAEILPGGALSRLLEECSNAFAMLLGLVGCCGSILFLSLMAGMKAVSSG